MWKYDFSHRIVMEWQDAYISYDSLSLPFTRLQRIYNDYHQQTVRSNEKQDIYAHLPEDTFHQLVQIDNKIKEVLRVGEQKFNSFYAYKKKEFIKNVHDLQKIITELSKEEIITHEHCEKRHQIKDAIKILYTISQYLQSFIDVNVHIGEKIIQKRNTYLVPFLSQNPLPIQSSEERQLLIENQPEFTFSLHVDGQQEFIKDIQKRIKSLYEELVFSDEKKTNRLEDYAFHHKKTSQKTYCLIGFYSGIAIIAIMTIFMLLAFDIVDLDYENRIDSMDYVFPMFRGVGLLILYLWGMAWNSYGFQQYKINYQLILEYGAHFSTPLSFVKRASFFTLVLFGMLLLYFVGLSYNVNKAPGEPTFAIEYTPFMVWVLYIGYIFFPNREVFNPNGRKYFYRVLKEVFQSPIFKMSFLISWVTDQSVSFVIPIKDLAYTLCFYTSNFSEGHKDEVQQCRNASGLDGFMVAYFIALFPLLFRMAQCYRQAVQDTGKFFGHLQMWNFGKYFSSIVTATFSYISAVRKGENGFIAAFVISSLVSTLYAYIWDLKYDWGLLQKNSSKKFLRNRLSYENPRLYYAAIVMNLLLRFSWTLTIAPFILSLIKSPLIPLITGLIQIFRRCMWNFFRVEKEHIANCNNYTPTRNINKVFEILLDEKKKQSLVDSELIPYIHFFKLKKSLLERRQEIPSEKEVKQLKEEFLSIRQKQIA